MQERILPLEQLFGLTRDGASGSDHANVFGTAFGDANRAHAIQVNNTHRIAQTEEVSKADYKAYVDQIREIALRELRRELQHADERGEIHRDRSDFDRFSVRVSRVPGRNPGYPAADPKLKIDRLNVEGRIVRGSAGGSNLLVEATIYGEHYTTERGDQEPNVVYPAVHTKNLHQESFTYLAKQGAQIEEPSKEDYKAYVNQIREIALRELRHELEHADERGELYRDRSDFDRFSVRVSRIPGSNSGYPPADPKLKIDRLNIEGKIVPGAAGGNKFLVEATIYSEHYTTERGTQDPSVLYHAVDTKNIHQEKFTYSPKNGPR